MAENSKIEWTDHTFNPWVGCTKISPACDHCYAEGWAKRTGGADLWQGERRRTTDANWRQPLKWNREAERDGVRRKVFCASLADVFDNQVLVEWRTDLWRLIRETPHLDWLLLTKRPQNIAKMLPGPLSTHPRPWPNVWLGTTVENQEEADRRIPHLLAVPAAVRFLSCEPLLGPVRLHDLQLGNHYVIDSLRGESWRWGAEGVRYDLRRDLARINWVIVGGESGPNRRPMDLAWARSIRDQCAAAGVAFFGKQLDKKTPLPADLMVRQFPEPWFGWR